MATSDVPYLQADGRRQLVVPVFDVQIVEWADVSFVVQAANVLFEILPEDGTDVTNRCIYHAGTPDSGSVWIRWTGDAAIHGAGSWEIAPGDEIRIPSRARVTGMATNAGIPLTILKG